MNDLLRTDSEQYSTVQQVTALVACTPSLALCKRFTSVPGHSQYIILLNIGKQKTIEKQLKIVGEWLGSGWERVIK